MLPSTLIMMVIAVVLLLTALKKDKKTAKEGLIKGWKTLLNTLPILVPAFLAAGLLETIIPSGTISELLGENSGFKGILIGSAAGILIPGGPYVAFPIIYYIYRTGASIPTTVSFITGWSVWSMGNWPYEIALIGPLFTVIRIASTLIFPLLAGIIAALATKFI